MSSLVVIREIPTPPSRGTVWKDHYVQKSLRSPLLADLRARSDGKVNFKVNPDQQPYDYRSWWWDVGGMCMADRSWERIHIFNLTISVPSEDFEHFYMNLREQCAPRFFGNVRRDQYRKIHSSYSCLVVREGTFQMLLKEVNLMRPEARVRGEKDNAEFNRRLLKAQAMGARVISHKQQPVNAVFPQKGEGEA